MQALSILVLALALVGLGVDAHANACFARSDAYDANPAELLRDSQAAYLVDARSIDMNPASPVASHRDPIESVSELLEQVRSEASREVRISFDVLETLHGERTDTYQLTRRSFQWFGTETTFNNHNDTQFWGDDGLGRAFQGGSCTLHVTFQVGATYLIIEGEQEIVKSFERIDNIEADRWLAFARDYFAR